MVFVQEEQSQKIALSGFMRLENRDKPQETEKMQLQSVSSRLGKKTIELEHLSQNGLTESNCSGTFPISYPGMPELVSLDATVQESLR